MEQASQYHIVKDALLQWYQLTEAGFRTKFIDSRAEITENAVEFLSRIDGYLTRWMQLAKVEETYESLRDLLLKEQLLKTCDKTLAMFVRERAPSTAQQTAEIANQFLQVHGGTLTDARNVMKRNVNKFQNTIFREQCYTCGAEGHKVEDCMVKPLQQKGAGQGRMLPTCQICQKRGHVASECWQRTTATLSPGAPKFVPRTHKPHPTAGCIEPETTKKAWQATACIAHNVVSTGVGRGSHVYGAAYIRPDHRQHTRSQEPTRSGL